MVLTVPAKRDYLQPVVLGVNLLQRQSTDSRLLPVWRHHYKQFVNRRLGSDMLILFVVNRTCGGFGEE